MKILTWNAHCENKKFEEILGFLETTDFDIACLQEVSRPLLRKMRKTRLWHITNWLDHYVNEGVKRNPCFLVILSNKNRVRVENQRGRFHPKTLRKSFISRLGGWVEKPGYHYIDAVVGEESIRIFNTHLSLSSGPLQRLAECESMLEDYLEGRTIVAGDMNPFAHPALNLFIGWLFAFEWGDFSINERERLVELLERTGLHVEKHGRSTIFPLSPIPAGWRVDFICPPQGSTILSREEFSYCGSDHRPIRKEIELPKN